MGKRCLVTGAAGFIGGALHRRLAAIGADVVGTAKIEQDCDAVRSQGLSCEVFDLAKPEAASALLAGVDIVFNVAAMFNETEGTDEEYYKVNHVGAEELAKRAAKAGCERFVQVSTVGVHGDVKEIPATEHSPYNPMDLYHRSKLAGERAVLALADDASHSMVVTVNRPAMVYGPGDLRQLKLFRAIARRRFAMIGDGTTLAHFGYIDDQVDSLLLSATRPREEVHGESFNIASGSPIELGDAVDQIARELDTKVPSVSVPLMPVLITARLVEFACKPLRVRPPLSRRRVGFFTHNRAFDLTKAREKLLYGSSKSWPDGVRETVQWYRQENLL